MAHRLRRQVRWGPQVSRRQIPSALGNTLFAHQTVFNIDEHWESIYHILYPCFAFGDRLYLSTNIEQMDRIQSYAVAQLFAALSGLEAVGVALAHQDAGPYQKILQSFIAGHDFSLSSRAEFMSPGTVWSTVVTTSASMTWTALIFAMLFGADTPIIKTDGLITKEMRERALEIVIEMAKQHDLDRVKRDLGLQVPRVDTRALDEPGNLVA